MSGIVAEGLPAAAGSTPIVGQTGPNGNPSHLVYSIPGEEEILFVHRPEYDTATYSAYYEPGADPLASPKVLYYDTSGGGSSPYWTMVYTEKDPTQIWTQTVAAQASAIGSFDSLQSAKIATVSAVGSAEPVRGAASLTPQGTVAGIKAAASLTPQGTVVGIVATILFFLGAFVACGQRPVLEVDVVATDANDGFVGLSEVSTGNLATNTIARVKGQTTPGDGGGGTFLWNGSAWVRFYSEDYSAVGKDSLDVMRFGAVADGASHPLSETYGTLEAAQADFPAATALTDEKDWAAIQSALNSLNTVNGNEKGGTVYLPAGHYVINKTLTIKGPSVTLQGAGQVRSYVEYTPSSGYALRLGMARDSTIAAEGTGGCPKNCRIKGVKFNNQNAEASTAIGFSTVTPLGGQDFWYVLYLYLEEADFEGFDVGVELTNTPICTLLNCSITGRSESLRMVKPDSVTIIGCDLNGTFIDRITDETPSQINYQDNINITMRLADTFTGDGVLSPGGGGFHATILGGELGHGKAVLDMNGGRLTIKGSNIEDITNPWAFRLDGPSRLTVENARLELGSSVTGDFSSMDSIFLIDSTTGTVSHPQLRIMEVAAQGWPSDKPHTIVKGDTTPTGTVPVIQDVEWRVEFQNSAGDEQATVEKAGSIVDWRAARVSISDTNAGNQNLKKGLFWYGASSNFPEDLLTPYKRADGTHYRSSVLNHRLIQTFSSLQSTQSSAAGDTGVFADPVLHQGTIPPLSVHDEGDKVKVECSGSFAANGNTKGIKFLIGWDDAVTPANGQNDFFGDFSGSWNGKDWHCEVTAVRRSAVNYRITTRLFIDGESCLVKNESLNVQLGQETRWRILPTGTAAGDVQLTTFDLRYEQGTSNL